eukprot:1161296-Pelagomonas_calceolata.AAC.4
MQEPQRQKATFCTAAKPLCTGPSLSTMAWPGGRLSNRRGNKQQCISVAAVITIRSLLCQIAWAACSSGQWISSKRRCRSLKGKCLAQPQDFVQGGWAVAMQGFHVWAKGKASKSEHSLGYARVGIEKVYGRIGCQIVADGVALNFWAS